MKVTIQKLQKEAKLIMDGCMPIIISVSVIIITRKDTFWCAQVLEWWYHWSGRWVSYASIDNMEIVTIPFSRCHYHARIIPVVLGLLKPGMFRSWVPEPEFSIQKNASGTETVNLFQLWVFQEKKYYAKRYDQRTFNINDRVNKWQVVVSPNEKDEALWIKPVPFCIN